jgi:hypothetical protein
VEVDEGDVRGDLGQRPQRVLGRGERPRREPLASKEVLDRSGQGGVVLDEEDARGDISSA